MSLIILLVRGIWASKLVKLLRGIETNVEVGHNQKSGIAIAVFKLARLAGILVLLGLSGVTAIKHGLKWQDLALMGTLVRSLSFDSTYRRV